MSKKKISLQATFALATTLLLAGCSNTTALSTKGQHVQFSEATPAANCRLLGTVTGTQSNWLSGSEGSGNAMRGAANDLRNKAAEMGGNLIYAATTPNETVWSNFAPLDSQMTGQVYQCP